MMRIAKRPPEAFNTVVTDRVTAPFWQAARAGYLTCAQCGDCGRFRMPPTPFCPRCLSERIEWPRLPGTGTVYSYTVVERAVLPGSEDRVPYVVAVIALEGAEPARLIANIVDSPVEDIAIGTRVDVIFDIVTDDAALPRFRIAELQA
jgi:uncharacterized OB-fold protein